jgi:hypothetical protein
MINYNIAGDAAVYITEIYWVSEGLIEDSMGHGTGEKQF